MDFTLAVTRFAADVLQDDYFKLAGEMYRVTSTATNAWGGAVITATCLNQNPAQTVTLIMPAVFSMKIYNQ